MGHWGRALWWGVFLFLGAVPGKAQAGTEVSLFDLLGRDRDYPVAVTAHPLTDSLPLSASVRGLTLTDPFGEMLHGVMLVPDTLPQGGSASAVVVMTMGPVGGVAAVAAPLLSKGKVVVAVDGADVPPPVSGSGVLGHDLPPAMGALARRLWLMDWLRQQPEIQGDDINLLVAVSGQWAFGEQWMGREPRFQSAWALPVSGSALVRLTPSRKVPQVSASWVLRWGHEPPWRADAALYEGGLASGSVTVLVEAPDEGTRRALLSASAALGAATLVLDGDGPDLGTLPHDPTLKACCLETVRQTLLRRAWRLRGLALRFRALHPHRPLVVVGEGTGAAAVLLAAGAGAPFDAVGVWGPAGQFDKLVRKNKTVLGDMGPLGSSARWRLNHKLALVDPARLGWADVALPVVVAGGRRDTFIPPDITHAVARGLGRDAIDWYATGHEGSPMVFTALVARVLALSEGVRDNRRTSLNQEAPHE